MATVSWMFRANGFRVQVASLGNVNKSKLNGDLPTSDITISFSRLNGGVLASITSGTRHGTTTVDVCPIGVPAVVSFEGDGHLDANWIVTRDSVSGKGRGKGIGKTTTG